MIMVSPIGALYRQLMEELVKVSKLPRAKLAVQGRCVVDAAIQGAYEPSAGRCLLPKKSEPYIRTKSS
jgi:hypothetical protein